MSERRVVIVGAGIAGAATAYFLAQRGQRVILLDRERTPGAHSTGRNAAILRTAIPEPALHALAADSRRFYASPPPGFSEIPLFESVGLYLGAAIEAAEDLRAWTARSDCSAGGSEVPPEQLYEAYPQLAHKLALTVHYPTEGAFDVNAILVGFLRGARAAGAEMRFGVEVLELAKRAERVVGVETSEGFVKADEVVIAGGGWAGRLPGAAGWPLGLTPKRRHLLVTAPLPELDPRSPVVWLAGDEFYFRPESGGLLLCACDQDAVEPEQGESLRDEVLERIAEKAARWLPGFDALEAAHYWAGMRTFADDSLFVVGPDPRAPGLHWVAGLGGHGITTGAAVGRLAAEWIAEGWSGHPCAQALLPRVPVSA
ncbi:MAG: FAD-binding oxidoreductase [Planctomycetes bacterium]|nr:FAD-binding oxidoreductase [Planctomycetota bacterium]